MATLAQINRDLRRAVEIVTGRIARDLILDLQASTRKDTTYHSSRWVGRAGGPPASRPTPVGREARAAALSFAQQRASIGEVQRFSIGQRVIYVSNDGDYINVLESQDGMARSAVARVPRQVSLAGTGLR